VAPGGDDIGGWIAFVSKFLVPQHGLVMNLQLHLLQMAMRRGGDFCGWSCPPVSHAPPAGG
jgi:hypothetical protein